ncbi:MAG: PD-(D/E)XK nuclease family protein [Turicibacter sp.]|nr:PD-(D/E)XK nuclease family protein [Turicibacter sp.]
MRIQKGIKEVVSYVYQSGDLNLEYFQANRAQYGTKAHHIVQEKYLEEECEVYIEHLLVVDEHEVQLNGRMDLLIEREGKWIVGEIKSTTRKLESIEENDRPSHYAQAKVYAYLLLCQHKEWEDIIVRLIYCDLDGIHQRHFDCVYTKETLEPFVFKTLRIYLEWYFILWRSTELKLKTAKTLQFPFGEFRAYQRELSGAVYQCIKQKKQLLLRAPTGIGKTMGTIFPSIKALTEHQQKIFYLTAKTIGRHVAEKAFDTCLANGWQAKVTTITAKEKICLMEEVRCDPSYCPYAKGYFDRINEATKDLFESEQLFNRDCLVRYAKKYQVCPFEYSLAMAMISDAIVCDYNYMFDPRAYLRRFFDEPSAHIALIDEAHNLYDRACEMYSASLRKEPIQELKRLFKDRHKPLSKALGALNLKFLEYRHDLEDAKSYDLFKDEIESSFLTKVQTLLEVLEKYLYKHPETEYKMQLMNLYFECHQFLRISEFYTESFRTRYERFGGDVKVSMVCLNPSLYLSGRMERVRSSILFSATLHPLSYYQTVLLHDEECEQIFLPSPFNRGHLDLYVHHGISTKYKQRNQTMAHLISTIYHVTRKKTGNYLVFFPSYQYLELVYEAYKELVSDEQQLLKQEREMDERAREVFLESFQTYSNQTLVAFAVLGGIFSEGIDLIGDRLIGSLIVGVGLPQINPLTEQRRLYFEQAFHKGYLYAYLYPGFNKVMQAVGRVIRTEEDCGVVVLIDERYIEPIYLSLFPYEWQHAKFLN